MKLLSVSLAALTLVGGSVHAAPADSRLAAGADVRKTYIVQLAAEPAASYTGTISGYAATRPVAGARFNARAANVRAYYAYLDAQQNAVASLVSQSPVLMRYRTAYNGFAIKLTPAEAARVKTDPAVLDVVPDEERKLETITTSAFLGLSTPGGVWSQTVGGVALKGENIIVGIVDGGVWPEGPSYADRVSGDTPVFSGGTLAYGAPPANWTGTCTAGEGFVPTTHCNNKLIGAQYFNAGFIASGRTKHWTEFFSPRDSVAGPTGHGGHGSHTSSTAAGNSGAPVYVLNPGIGLGPASGMAPRARIAVYKVCYTYVDAQATDGTGSTNSCFTTDSVAAIDKAVADGVQVINYSISGSQTSVNDPVEQAFLRAASAGVFVAASAGNSGPAVAVAHVSPWLTTVGASTHDRGPTGDVTLGNGAKYSGASFNNTPLPSKPLIRAEDAGLPGADPTQLKLCYLAPTVLDPAKISGKIVICTRGTNARVDKSAAVAAGGGVGMVLVDNGTGLVADFHSVPTVHVVAADGAAIQAYTTGTPGATASISSYYNVPKPAPIMASFSSRGPNQGDNNMLKPDLTAPGVDVIATVTPALTQAQRDQVANNTLVPPPDWASYQGTSMSSPHVAGVAALLRQAKPTWSPQAIKSALMTTAYSTLNDGVAGDQNGLLPFSQGSGHISPAAALDPGLVYDNSPADFTRYQCLVNRAAVVPASDCTTLGTLDQTYNYNLPTVTVGSVVGAVTVTRRVTNVGTSSATYTGSATVPGFTPLLTPTTLTLAPGETKSFTLRLTTSTAAANVWNYGSMVWSDGVHSVKSPVTAKAGNPISSPASVTANSTSGSRVLTVQTGFAGKMTANKGGLKDVTTGPTITLSPSTLSSAQLKTACTAGVDTASVKVYPVSIPLNTMVARFALRQADVGGATDDNDMGLLAPDGTWVYSGNDGSNEAVEVVNPAAGSYKVCVLAYGGSPSMSHKLSSWIVTTTDVATPNNLNVLLPGTVYSGASASVGLSWSGLVNGSRYVGAVQFKDAGSVVRATTTVRIDPNGGVPLAVGQAKAVPTDQLKK